MYKRQVIAGTIQIGESFEVTYRSTLFVTIYRIVSTFLTYSGPSAIMLHNLIMSATNTSRFGNGNGIGVLLSEDS